MTPYFQNDNVTIYNMDCLTYFDETEDLFDAVVADPPYLLSAKSAASGKLNPWGDIINASRFFRSVFEGTKSHLVDTGMAWFCLNWRTLASYQKGAYDAGWDFTSVLVWDKQWISCGGVTGLRPSHELVGLLQMPEARIVDRSLADIQPFKYSGKKPHGHPAEKPISLMEFLVKHGSPDGGIILDPFMGSGTSLEAADRLGRKAVGIELDESWCEVAAKRVTEI